MLFGIAVVFAASGSPGVNDVNEIVKVVNAPVNLLYHLDSHITNRCMTNCRNL